MIRTEALAAKGRMNSFSEPLISPANATAGAQGPSVAPAAPAPVVGPESPVAKADELANSAAEGDVSPPTRSMSRHRTSQAGNGSGSAATKRDRCCCCKCPSVPLHTLWGKALLVLIMLFPLAGPALYVTMSINIIEAPTTITKGAHVYQAMLCVLGTHKLWKGHP